MNHWLDNEPLCGHGEAPAVAPAQRGLDLVLSLALLLLLVVPLLAALHAGRLTRSPRRGQGGACFDRLGLQLPDTATGRVLRALGACHWPVLLNILRGQMAFVGPRPREPGEPGNAPVVRPGLANPWFIRRRTAVAFGTETEADAAHLARRSLRHDAGMLLRAALVALLTPPASKPPGRVQVADVTFDNVDLNEALSRLRDMLDARSPQQVCFVNPACVNIAAGHRGYRRALARAALVLPDGIGVKIAGDLLGTPLKQNVNGTDLFPRLCEMLQARGARLFLLGGQPGVAARVASEISQRWPGLAVAGHRDGFFSVAQEGAVAAQVRASGADVLLVARGVPAQDLFIDRHLPMLGVRVAMGVGGLFDFVSGRIARAPVWMRECGLEWVYRLLQEPGRMWRRYLIGNFSFLLRVTGQRLGLRRPAADALPHARPATGSGQGVRAVLFASTCAPHDVPVALDQPVALLPLGSASVIERLMAQLSQAAVGDVDLVVGDRPEALREQVGDGSRWGLRVHWHLVKDTRLPYAVLRNPALQAARRVVIGHADQAVATPALLRLAATEQVCFEADAHQLLAWSGWASLAPAQLAGLPHHGDAGDLAAGLRALDLPATFWNRADAQRLDSAARLLQAQFDADDPAAVPAPASWIRKPWGAMSPQAHVDEGAVMHGPVLVGPGSVVERGAEVGPQVVLGADVIVSSGSRLQQALVLPHAYIGADLDISQAIVNGPRVRHLRLDVETTLAVEDALLLDLRARAPERPALAGRALAALLLAAVGPVLVGHGLKQRLAGGAPAWTRRPVVAGRGANQRLRTVMLRCPRADAGRAQRLLAGLAALMDIVAGRRCWLGVRPRLAGEWYALRPEWQALLDNAPVGLLHAPAWSDASATHAEASAAADILHTVLPPGRRALHLAAAWWRVQRAGRGGQAAR